MHIARLSHVIHLKSNKAMNKHHGIIILAQGWKYHIPRIVHFWYIFVPNSMDTNQTMIRIWTRGQNLAQK
jgi:hypothetical protein